MKLMTVFLSIRFREPFSHPLPIRPLVLSMRLCMRQLVCLVPFFAIQGGISVGQLSCFLSYANQYTKPFNEISGVVTELQNAIACAGRVLELIEETPEIPDSEDAIKLGKADGKVEIEDVYFSYEPNQKLIEHFNLQVKPGQRVAIVGPTGCGKTTLINLLMRFYDVNSGAIKVSEKDIRKVTRESLRANYGMVLQETWLKQGTIRENIVMGRENATDDEVLARQRQVTHTVLLRDFQTVMIP